MTRKLNLMLHCGSHYADRDELKMVETPKGSRTWQPIPHNVLVDEMLSTVEGAGYQIAEEAHGLGKDGNLYFGMFQVQPGDDGAVLPDDYGLVFGLRNSHDQSFAASVCMGSGVFVCDNLAFSGEVKLARRHTRFIKRDLPNLMGRAIHALGDLRAGQDTRIGQYKEHELRNKDVHDFLIRALDARVLPATSIPKVLKSYRHPEHREFKECGPTAWRLFNSFTENLKNNVQLLPQRTSALHGLMDAEVGLSLAK
jgi:hypothetical protein